MVATPTRVLLWSLWARDIATKNGGTIRSGIDVLALGATGRWNNVTGNWPQARSVDGPVYAGGKVLIPPAQIWCGTCPHPFGDSPAKLAGAQTLAVTTIPAGPLVTQPLTEPPIWLWTGRTALAATLDTSASSKTAPDGRLAKLAAYDPLSRRWYVLPSPPARPALGAGPILAGDRLLVLTLDGSLLSLHR
jgi:hypothetical protein